MSRVALISYAGYPYTPSSLMPDNGLASLAGCLLASGHETRILDYSTVSTVKRLFPEEISRSVKPLADKLFLSGTGLTLLEKFRFVRAGTRLDAHQKAETAVIAREIAEEVARFGADIVGLKLWNGDGFSGSVTIAETIRARLPNVKILGGGPQVDYFHRHILNYTKAFDVLLRGEGEAVLPRLVEAMASNKDWQTLPGIVWRDGERIRSNRAEALTCLDELPLPVYDTNTYPALTGDNKIRIAVLDESRGCPNRCAFCIHPIKSGGTWTLKSPSRIIAEMQRLGEQLKTRFFIYSGSNTSAKVAVGIAKDILEHKLDVRYGCFGHIRGIAKADFDLLRKSGCEAIFYGMESGSPRILRDAFDKPMNLDLAERVIKETREAGIYAITSLIFPAPFENDESREETLEFLRRAKPDSVPVTIPGMIPGTPWERQAEKYGFEKSRRKDLWEYALTYKIKLLYPPSLWKPLPYRLNGMSSRRLMRVCENFMSQLEKSGTLTNVPHEFVLMAEALGEKHDLRGFRDRCRASFVGGDVASIQRMVQRINEGVAVDKPTNAMAEMTSTVGT